jgi:hypothetical protein
LLAGRTPSEPTSPSLNLDGCFLSRTPVAITDEASPFVLRSTRNRLRRAVRRGAASCRAVRGSCQWRRRSGPQHRCRHRGAVLGGRAPPGAVTRVRSGRPAGVADARMSGRRPRWSFPCPRPGPAAGRPSSPSSGRPTSSVRCPVSRRPVFRCPVFRCPDGQACAVRGNAAARSASRWTWSGWVWGPPGWAQRVQVPPVSAGGGRLPASGLTGCDGAAVGRARLPRGRPSPRADAWPASRLRRRLAAGPTRAGPGPGCRPGGGARDAAGAHRSSRGASGRSAAWCPDHGL